jgi:protein-disulfide isomerase
MADSESGRGIPRLAAPVDERDHARGPADARSTLVLYGDYECPYTRRALPAVQELRDQLGDRLRFVFRPFPLREIHPHAQMAAEAAEAAAAQGRFWSMHDRLFAHQKELGGAQLGEYAAAIGLDPARFGHELAAHSHAARIEEHVRSGIASGVEGTPTFFVDGLRHDGGYDSASLRAALEASAGTARG